MTFSFHNYQALTQVRGTVYLGIDLQSKDAGKIKHVHVGVTRQCYRFEHLSNAVACRSMHVPSRTLILDVMSFKSKSRDFTALFGKRKKRSPKIFFLDILPSK